MLGGLRLRGGAFADGAAPADHTQRTWAYTRMQALCRDLGTATRLDGDLLVIEPDAVTAHE